MRNVGSMLSVEHHLALQQQLIREARLLDEESFDDWLALLNDDVRYRLPLAERRFRKDRSAPSELGSGYISMTPSSASDYGSTGCNPATCGPRTRATVCAA